MLDGVNGQDGVLSSNDSNSSYHYILHSLCCLFSQILNICQVATPTSDDLLSSWLCDNDIKQGILRFPRGAASLSVRCSHKQEELIAELIMHLPDILTPHL